MPLLMAVAVALQRTTDVWNSGQHLEHVPWWVALEVASVGQLAFATLVACRPTRRRFLVAAGVELVSAAIWAVSTTLALPDEPRLWEPSIVVVVQVAALGVQLLSTVLLILLARRTPSGGSPPPAILQAVFVVLIVIGTVPAAVYPTQLTVLPTLGLTVLALALASGLITLGRIGRRRVTWATAAGLSLLVSAVGLGQASLAYSSHCLRSSTHLTALPDLGAARWLGESGGLYPDGSDQPPPDYASAGRAAAARVTPRDAGGRPSSMGRIVLLSIGMSNATQEFSAFMRAEQADPTRNPDVTLVDGAQDSATGSTWANASAQAWTIAAQRLAAAAVTDAQVQVLWLEEADALPSGAPLVYAHMLYRELGRIVKIAAARFPNLQQVFVSSVVYEGYAAIPLQPEPYGYASGFAAKWLVAASVAAPLQRPWIGWSAYTWTDGTRGRADGMTWTCNDVRDDGTHPGNDLARVGDASGGRRVADALHRLFTASEFSPWFHRCIGYFGHPFAKFIVF